MRQSMHDLDVEVLEERIRDAVLLTHAARPARLQDMSFAEPSYRLRDHSLQPSGEKVIRSACSRVERSEEVALSLFYRSRAGAQIYGRPQEIESQGQFRDKELRSAIQGTLQQDPASAVLSYDKSSLVWLIINCRNKKQMKKQKNSVSQQNVSVVYFKSCVVY